ncbi:MAG: aspartyl/glutamyl-tRNA amidotransferase subunit A [Clostridia bacterium]|nr:aspartyl/glutamyl-tRNA amidotransferase subunit A [Clostridia bacterium]
MITKTAEALRRGETTARALTEAALARIRERGEETNAFITVLDEYALSAADRVDERIKAGDASLLCGIPAALKDNILTEGIPTTAASLMLSGFSAPFSAAAWEGISAAGGVLVGKTNLDEFAMGSFGETSAFGPVRNPLSPSHSAGGSSSGSAAAVADGQAMFALGSDTGGSVRVPAAFCGVVGLKPTYGRISRRGLIAFASSLDTVGILTRTVRDAAIVLDAAAVPDAGDMTMIPREDTLLDWLSAMERGVRDIRVGVVRNLPLLAPEVKEAYERSISVMEAHGAKITEVTIPAPDDAYTAYYIIAASEASSNLARYDGIRYGTSENGSTYTEGILAARRRFGAEIKRRLLAGTFALSFDGRADYYEKACRLRREITSDLNAQFARADVLLLPTVPHTATRLFETVDDGLPYQTADCLCTAASLAGLPAVSVPLRRAGEMPVGIEIIAPFMREDLLFAAARALEEGVSDD